MRDKIVLFIVDQVSLLQQLINLHLQIRSALSLVMNP